MNRSADIRHDHDDNAAKVIGMLVHTAMLRGLAVGSQVRMGTVQGIVIGYNIARDGAYPGTLYPLLVKTELGTAKFGLDEVIPA
jgi:hypothetical protein